MLKIASERTQWAELKTFKPFLMLKSEKTSVDDLAHVLNFD
jgi:hypothetical protein